MMSGGQDVNDIEKVKKKTRKTRKETNRVLKMESLTSESERDPTKYKSEEPW